MAHLDHDPSNSNEENLVYLCLPHHDDYDTKRRQTKNIIPVEVKTARDRLYDMIEKGDVLGAQCLVSENNSPPGNSISDQRAVILNKICQNLCDARDLFQGATRGAWFAGEPSIEEFRDRAVGRLASAQSVLVRHRLLVPPQFISLCDEFVREFAEGLAMLAGAQDPAVPSGFQRAAFWDKASAIGRNDIPPLLEKIESIGRNLIQGS